MNEEQIKQMVNRFLQWKLPDDFYPDNGIHFSPFHKGLGGKPVKNEPVGTNLLTATQAEEMIRYILETTTPLPKTGHASINGSTGEIYDITPIPSPANINRRLPSPTIQNLQSIENIVSPWAEFDPKGHYFTVKDPHGFYKAMLSIHQGDVNLSIAQHDQALRTKLIEGVDSLDKRYGEQYTRPISYQVIQDTKKVINHTYGDSDG